MPKGNNTINKNEQYNSLFDKGIQIIASAFNEQENYYSQKISELNNEITSLKEENLLYKKKISDFQKKIKTLSKTVCQFDIDDIDFTVNTLEKNSNSSNIDPSSQKEVINNGSSNISINSEDISNNKKLYTTSKSTFYKNVLFPPNNNINNLNINYDYDNSFNIKNLDKNQRIKSLTYYLNNDYDNNTSSAQVINLNNLGKEDNEDLKNIKTLRDSLHPNNLKNFILTNKEPKSCRDFKKKRIFSQKYLKSSKNFTKQNYENKKGDTINFNKKLKLNEDDNAQLYQKLNIFLVECKKKLTAEDYDKMIDLLNAYEGDPNFDVKKKINKILSNNHKLIRLFEDIFQS